MTTAELSARPTMSLPETSSKAPPTEFRILRAGLNKTEKGTFLFDAEAAEAVMAAYTAKGLGKLQVDFEHQSMVAPPGGGDASKPAAGWFKPEVRAGELWATEVAWTARALAMLAPATGAPEYRYFSPILLFDETTRRVTAVKNLALTNDPAMYELEPLVAARAPIHSTQQEESMFQPNQSTTALSATELLVAKHLGTNPEKFLAFKIRQAEDQALTQPGMVSLSGLPGEVMLTAEDIKLARQMGNDLRAYVEYRLKRQADQERLRRIGVLP